MVVMKVMRVLHITLFSELNVPFYLTIGIGTWLWLS